MDAVTYRGLIYLNGQLTRGSIVVSRGLVKSIGGVEGVVIDLPPSHFIMPPMADIHVHLRDLELSYKEDVESGSAAALAGGVAALGNMPNTKPPIKTINLLKGIMDVIKAKSRLRVRQYFGAPEDVKVLEEAYANGAWAVGEVFPEEVAEYGGDDYLEALFREASRVGIPIIMHCEDPVVISQYSGPRDFKYHGEVRGPRAELACVANVIKLTYRYGARIHLTHITLPQSIQLVKSSGLNITIDATPHHMLLSQEECLSRVEVPGYCKVNPPLRSREVREGLLRAFIGGLVDIVASDHAPHAQWEKERPYDEAPPGIVGLETTLPLMLTLWVRGFVDLETIVKAINERPMRFLGFEPGLKVGQRADFVIVGLGKSIIDPSRFRSKAKFTPFKGFEVDALVAATVLNGELAYVNTDDEPLEGALRQAGLLK